MISATSNLAQRYPARATAWRLPRVKLGCEHLPLLMGIVNVTPDSFSDGGHYFDKQRAIDHGLQLAAEGAAILDIGGESTRPYSQRVDTTEELRRVAQVVQSLAEQTDVPISIDTSKWQVAREAVAAGAQIINDVTGLADPLMIRLAVETRIAVCAMHMQGTPQTMQDNPKYGDVVAEIRSFLQQRYEQLQAAGMDGDQICLDPGIGFGKTHEHNLTLLRHAGEFHRLACPLMIGHSRKGFLAKILGDKQADRTLASVAVSLAMASQGIQILRVHDVLPTRQALQSFAAAGGTCS